MNSPICGKCFATYSDKVFNLQQSTKKHNVTYVLEEGRLVMPIRFEPDQKFHFDHLVSFLLFKLALNLSSALQSWVSRACFPSFKVYTVFRSLDMVHIPPTIPYWIELGDHDQKLGKVLGIIHLDFHILLQTIIVGFTFMLHGWCFIILLLHFHWWSVICAVNCLCVQVFSFKTNLCSIFDVI